MDDLKGFGGISNKYGDSCWSSGDIEPQLGELSDEVREEQASIPPKVRPSDQCEVALLFTDFRKSILPLPFSIPVKKTVDMRHIAYLATSSYKIR